MENFDSTLILKQPQAPNTWYYLYDSFYGLRHPLPLLLSLGTSATYLLLVYVIWPAMRGFAQANVGTFSALRKMHNIFLFLYSAICFGTTFLYMLNNGEFNVFGEKGLEPMLCNEIPEWLWLLNVTFVFSKIYEWLDTAFLVWMKRDASKDLSFLHVYHHATTFWLFLNVSNMASTVKQGMLFNGFVHTLMYAHYAWPFPKPLVPLITISQIFQLIFVTWVWGATPSRCPAYAAFPEKYPFEFWTNYAFAPVYLIFFVHFFAKRFLFGGGKKSRRSAEGAPVSPASSGANSPTGGLVRKASTRQPSQKVD